MNKEIEKLQTRLKEAIFDQERKKVRYDAHVIVAEGHRKQISEIMENNQRLLHELMDSGRVIEEFRKQIEEATEKERKESGDLDLKKQA